ncbi:MAG: N-acetylneuraminate synthase family protein, partial [Pseudomonadota bacterium]
VIVPTFHDTIFEGISDHSIGIAAALMAAARGAKYLEKHYTINYAWQRSNEKAHLGAMTLEDLRAIKRITSDMERILASS